jgi:hypothetical protein
MSCRSSKSEFRIKGGEQTSPCIPGPKWGRVPPSHFCFFSRRFAQPPACVTRPASKPLTQQSQLNYCKCGFHDLPLISVERLPHRGELLVPPRVDGASLFLVRHTGSPSNPAMGYSADYLPLCQDFHVASFMLPCGGGSNNQWLVTG